MSWGIVDKFIKWGTGPNEVSSRDIPADYTPTNYTPSQVSSEGNDKVSAHLKGINNALGSSSGVTRIPDGGTLSGEYWGDVICEGEASITNHVTVNGNLFCIASSITNITSTGSYNLTVNGHLLGGRIILTLNSTTPATNGGSLTVQGDCLLWELYSNGQDASSTANAGNGGYITIYGNCKTSNIYVNGGNSDFSGRKAGNGGPIYIYQNVNFGVIESKGGQCTHSTGTGAGNGGGVTLGTVTYGNSVSTNGGNNYSSSGPAGLGGSVTIYDRASLTYIYTNGGSQFNSSNNANAGNGGQVEFYSDISRLYGIVTNGGDSQLGNAGLAGNIIIRGRLEGSGATINIRGGHVNGSGSTGTPGNGGNLSVFGFATNTTINSIGGNRPSGTNTRNGGNGGTINLYGGGSNIDISVSGGNTNNGTGGISGSTYLYDVHLNSLTANDGTGTSQPTTVRYHYLKGRIIIGSTNISNRTTIRIRPVSNTTATTYKVNSITGLNVLTNSNDTQTGTIDSTYLYTTNSSGNWLRIGPGASF